MKTVCRTLGLARLHVRDLLKRGDDWTDGRTHRAPHDDDVLLTELRQPPSSTSTRHTRTRH